MKLALKIFLLFALVSATTLAKPESSASTTEDIAELEEDLDTDDDSKEEVHDDVHCEEVERLKDYYCTTAHCKHFYSKHCYDIIDGVHPTCEKVRSCIEARVGKFRTKAEKHKNEDFKNGSEKLFLSYVAIIPTIIFSFFKVYRL